MRGRWKAAIGRYRGERDNKERGRKGHPRKKMRVEGGEEERKIRWKWRREE